MKCSICFGEIDVVGAWTDQPWTEGHNAQPVNDGRCCTTCNDTVVIPARLRLMFAPKGKPEAVATKTKKEG